MKSADCEIEERAAAEIMRLARKGLGHTRPNPPVGAAIFDENGEIAGRGWHKAAGGDHAETAAIKDALARAPDRLRSSTLYVSLEPCSKPGRVGACTDAIIASGIRRVRYASVDPNPVNRGGAEAALSCRGIDCRRIDKRLIPPFDDLIRPFAKHVATGLPYTTVKIAISLDGKTCDDSGAARWVSSGGARAATDRLRMQVDAIMVGAETVRRDNPSLLPHSGENPDLVRVVVSRSGVLPPDAAVFADGRNKTLVFRDGAEALRELGRMGMTHVLCEGGLELARSLAAAGLVDEWISVLAPCVVGHGPIEEKVLFGAPEVIPAEAPAEDRIFRWRLAAKTCADGATGGSGRCSRD